MSTDPSVSRRGILVAGGAALLGAAGGYAVARTGADEVAPSAAPAASPSPAPTAVPGQGVRYPFFGEHQAGVETEPALFQTFVGMNLIDPSRDVAERTLRIVSDDASRWMSGEPALGDAQPELASNAEALTVSVGLGRPFFERSGLQAKIPPQLVDLPSFENDALDDRWGQTDLLIQIGANDPVTVSHTLRMVTKDLSTLASIEWIQDGFLSTAVDGDGGVKKRNLMGWTEGAHFPAPGSPEFEQVVWINDGPEWVTGGTVLVLRRMRMLLDTWDILDRSAQETVMGRSMTDGKFIGNAGAGDVNPFDAVDSNGLPTIPMDAHVRVAHSADLSGVIMRRPYNYDNGIVDGTNDVGLLFAAYMRDPRTSFIPTQQRLTDTDAFSRWISAVGSAVYLFPAGARDGGFLAEGLLA